jgi:hypothetical protein
LKRNAAQMAKGRPSRCSVEGENREGEKSLKGIRCRGLSVVESIQAEIIVTKQQYRNLNILKWTLWHQYLKLTELC